MVTEIEVRDAAGEPLALRNASASTVARAACRRGHRRPDGHERLGLGRGRRREPSPGRGARGAARHAARRPRFTARGPPERGRPQDPGPLQASRHATDAPPVRTAPGPEPGGSDIQAIAAARGRAHAGAERGDRPLLPPGRPRAGEARARLRAAELAKAGPLADRALSRYVTVGPGARAGAHPAPRQLARRVGRGRQPRRSRCSCPPLDTGGRRRHAARPRALAHLAARTRSPPASS